MTVSSFFVTTKNNNNMQLNDVVFNLNSLNFVGMKYENNNVNLLVDTGASLCVFFENSINKNLQSINSFDAIKIRGIAGSTKSLGSANICLQVNKVEISHKFTVMKAFDGEMDGVLGSDFFEKYSASFDYANFTFSFLFNNNKITIPMESKYNDYKGASAM